VFEERTSKFLSFLAINWPVCSREDAIWGFPDPEKEPWGRGSDCLGPFPRDIPIIDPLFGFRSIKGLFRFDSVVSSSSMLRMGFLIGKAINPCL